MVAYDGTKQPFTILDSTDILWSFEICFITLRALQKTEWVTGLEWTGYTQ